MRLIRYLACALSLTIAGAAHSQSISELKAQLQETRQLIAQAEAAGMDPSLLQSLRESMAVAEQAIREMEADAASSGGSGPSDSSTETASSSTAGAITPKDPVAMPGCSAVGVNQGNYREAALSGGNDVQLKTMCGQAFEYYAMYRRALDQGYSEADANRTYDAHAKSAAVANNFYDETRTN